MVKYLLNVIFVISLLCLFDNYHVNGLSKYCSSILSNDDLKNISQCFSEKIQTNVAITDETKLNASKNLDESLSLLKRVVFSLENSNMTKYDIKHLFLDVTRLVEIVDGNSELQVCLKFRICGFFKSCEFPMQIEYNEFENDAIVAARMASLLTMWTYNERIYNTTILTDSFLNALLRLSVADHTNIYMSRVEVRDSTSDQRRSYEAVKQRTEIKLRVPTMLMIERTKNNNWFYRWWDAKNINITKPEVNDEYADENIAKLLKKRENPTALYLNRYFRFVSDVTYDCWNQKWNRIVSVPFIYPGGEIRGIFAVYLSLNNFDLQQCEPMKKQIEYHDIVDEEMMENSENITEEGTNSCKENDPFCGTDKCERTTTECVNIPGKGFKIGSYVCKCKDGFYHPNSTNFNGFDGVRLEALYSNQTPSNIDYRYHQFKCLPCSKGCNKCNDSSPCETEISKEIKLIALTVNLTCIGLCIILIIVTWYHMTLKVLKTSSPKMLFMVLLGAIISYMEIIPLYFPPNSLTCIAAQVFQLEGFLLAYGALVLKTWRECKLFYVKSVKTIKISDKSLFKRLAIIVGIGATYLAAWAGMQNRPQREEKRDNYGLKYETCSVTFWNFISMSIQMAILLWGAVLSYQVRRASISFKETKLITWAIFNEGVVCIFVILVNILLQYTNVSVYASFGLNFIRMHLAITIMLILLFSYKIYTIIVARKKPFHTTQSSGLLNSFSVSSKETEQANVPLAEETDREREMKDEIRKLYRQIEEMRSLSMRIANPHLVPKKGKTFMGYQKKSKLNKNKNLLDVKPINYAERSIQENESQYMNEKSKIDSEPETATIEKSNNAQTVKFKTKP